MTEQKILKVNIKNVQLGHVSSIDRKFNINHAICKSNKPTSAELKCILPSNLDNLKLITDMSFPFSTLNFNGFKTEITFKLDKEYNIANNILADSNSGVLARTIQFDARSYWKLYDNSVEDYTFLSTSTNNKNSMEAIVPPSSCFNLTIKDNISALTISYSATASMIAYQNDVPVSGAELQSLASGITSNNAVSNIEISTPISGSITFNVVTSDFTELTPCY